MYPARVLRRSPLRAPSVLRLYVRRAEASTADRQAAASGATKPPEVTTRLHLGMARAWLVLVSVRGGLHASSGCVISSARAALGLRLGWHEEPCLRLPVARMCPWKEPKTKRLGQRR